MTYTSMAAEYPDKIRPLAVAAEKRAKALPDVPTFKELGFEYVEGAFRGVAVPPGTPGDVKKILEQAFAQVNQDPEVIRKMEDLGFIMEDYGEGASRALVKKWTVYYGNLLKELGLLKK